MKTRFLLSCLILSLASAYIGWLSHDIVSRELTQPKKEIVPNSKLIKETQTYAPTKMSQFPETDSLNGSYFIAILKQENGTFKNVKINARLFVQKEEILLMLQNQLIINERLKKLEAK